MKTLYFCTDKWLGRSPVLDPRVPTSRDDEESLIPRICVAPSVRQCYAALGRGAHCIPHHVYVVETDRSVPADKTVFDRRRTGERWLLEPTKFQHVLKMPKIKVFGAEIWHTEAYRNRLIGQNVEAEWFWQLSERRRQA